MLPFSYDLFQKAREERERTLEQTACLRLHWDHHKIIQKTDPVAIIASNDEWYKDCPGQKDKLQPLLQEAVKKLNEQLTVSSEKSMKAHRQVSLPLLQELFCKARRDVLQEGSPVTAYGWLKQTLLKAGVIHRIIREEADTLVMQA